MPRPRKHALFELGGQWIAREHGTGQLYRFWNDAGAGRTRRASLGTPDLERAKLIFAEAVIKGAARSASDHLSLILEAYFEARTDHLPSKDQARFAGAAMLECWGELVRANALTPAKQKAFAEWSIARGHSLSYVSRNLSVLAAAIAHAKLKIEMRYDEASILAMWPDLRWKPRRAVFVPADAELAAFFSIAMPANLFRWAVMACLTGSRPEALNELAPATRSREAGLVDLNPEGRRQTKKYRPIVRAPGALTGWLDKWEEEGLDATGGTYCGYDSREGLKTALQRVRTSDARLQRLTLYSFRHKVTAVLRAAGGVSEDEIAWQLGHRRPNLRTTAAYGERSPDYLKASAAALDAWWRRLQTLTETALFSQGIPKALRTRTKRAA